MSHWIIIPRTTPTKSATLVQEKCTCARMVGSALEHGSRRFVLHIGKAGTTSGVEIGKSLAKSVYRSKLTDDWVQQSAYGKSNGL